MNAATTLQITPARNLDDPESLFAFCRDNVPLQIERTASGALIVREPTGGESGARNAELTAQLVVWARQDGTGRAFDSNTGFLLPNGALRAPDAAWVRKSRLADLTAREKQQFLPLAPDFVVELRSETDSLRTLQEKMVEYVDNGVRLAVLLDPATRAVWLYRPEAPAQRLHDPLSVDASPELPGFALDSAALFDATL